MKFWWKGKAHRKTETEAVRFGLRFLYFTAGRENNQLEYLSDDHIATPPTEQGFLEFKESKTRLLHGNKLRQQIVGDCLKADFAPSKIELSVAIATVGHDHHTRRFSQLPSRFPSSVMYRSALSSAVNDVNSGSPSRMRMVRRISLGMTTRPRSSIRRTIPVAFIYADSPLTSFYWP